MRVEASLDRATGIATWRLRALDPITFRLVDDPLAGFLPPNRVPPEGDGYVTLFAKPRAGLRTGATITNRASIVFDTNAPIVTPTVRNRVDRTPPTSRIVSVRRQRGGRMLVRWTGRDRGAGARRYALFASENGAPFRLIKAATSRRSLRFRGRPGRRYTFVTSAMDAAGNAEPAPAVGDLLAPGPRVVRGRVTVNTYAAWPGRLTATAVDRRGKRIAILRGSRIGSTTARTTRTSQNAGIRQAGRVRLALAPRRRRAAPDGRPARHAGGPLKIPLQRGRK